MTCNGRTVGENYTEKHSWDRDVIRAYDAPLMEKAGFLNLKGSLFDSAIMKTCVISEEFAARYLRNPDDPMAFEGRVVVFEGPEDYYHRIDDPALDIDDYTILIMRGAGPIGLSRRRRGGEHAAAGEPYPARRDLAALHRRRAAIRHLRYAFDPQRLSGGRGRAAGSPCSRPATASASTSTPAAPTSCCQPKNWNAAAPTSPRAAVSPTRPRRPRGRRSTARTWRSSPTGWC